MNSSELLDNMLERPTLYVGHESIIKIKAFIDGYEYAHENASRDKTYDEFQRWVAQYFNVKSAHDWASIILFMALSEKRAFELTKELWAEFKADIQQTEED
jgi:hypothetical protein